MALLVLATAAVAAAMMLLTTGSSSTGVHPIVASAFASVMGTGRKQYEECDSPWWNACGGGLSCYDPKNGRTRYCVLIGQENACCGWSDSKEASGIDCGKDLTCDHHATNSRCLSVHDTVSTWHASCDWGVCPKYFAQKKSCKVNTGEPADILIEFKDRDPFDCGTIRDFVSF